MGNDSFPQLLATLFQEIVVGRGWMWSVVGRRMARLAKKFCSCPHSRIYAQDCPLSRVILGNWRRIALGCSPWSLAFRFPHSPFWPCMAEPISQEAVGISGGTVSSASTPAASPASIPGVTESLALKLGALAASLGRLRNDLSSLQAEIRALKAEAEQWRELRRKWEPAVEKFLKGPYKLFLKG